MSDDMHAVWAAIDELRGEARSAYKAAIRVLFAGLGGAVMLGVSLAMIYADTRSSIADLRRENLEQQRTLDLRKDMIESAEKDRLQTRRIALLLDWVAKSTQTIATDQGVRLPPMPTGVGHE